MMVKIWYGKLSPEKKKEDLKGRGHMHACLSVNRRQDKVLSGRRLPAAGIFDY